MKNLPELQILFSHDTGPANPLGSAVEQENGCWNTKGSQPVAERIRVLQKRRRHPENGILNSPLWISPALCKLDMTNKPDAGANPPPAPPHRTDNSCHTKSFAIPSFKLEADMIFHLRLDGSNLLIIGQVVPGPIFSGHTGKFCCRNADISCGREFSFRFRWVQQKRRSVSRSIRNGLSTSCSPGEAAGSRRRHSM